jgi:hypothetical protein
MGRSVVPDIVAPPNATIANVVLSLFPPPPPLFPHLPPHSCRAIQTLHAQYQQPGAPIGKAEVHHPIPAGPYQLIALAHGQALLGYARVGAQHSLQPRVEGVTQPHYWDLPNEVLNFRIAVITVRAILIQHHLTVRGVEFRLHPRCQQPVSPQGWKLISEFSAFCQESKVVDPMESRRRFAVSTEENLGREDSTYSNQ